ncbi:uncharacterized protein LAESUDRAFT_729923 [Laetiporus sulphureus 93-53]|uniref:Uncharacterized protein n=1 Tax=Laetiporus sulphureus 93-53 TaxID=1314785 RepID=A0A165CEQ7_9APHY|nr:uncharacterized protein LAESUDRAFT_729923 [Laetiporus sulphureus 93-53]KZT02679.1 hypothetical protein LAESUDRAFT_729923 [Laetiporus sulphureus 93-53]
MDLPAHASNVMRDELQYLHKAHNLKLHDRKSSERRWKSSTSNKIKKKVKTSQRGTSKFLG